MDVRNSYPEIPPRSNSTIRAELIGPDQCEALGHIVRSPSPVIGLCKTLVAAGHDPGLRLEACRGDVLCLTCRSIGEAATLEVNAYGTGFIRCPRRARRDPPMRSPRKAGVGHRPAPQIIPKAVVLAGLLNSPPEYAS